MSATAADLRAGPVSFIYGDEMLRFDVKSGDKSERGFQRGLLKNYRGNKCRDWPHNWLVC